MLEWRWWGVRCRLSLWFPASIIVMLSLDSSGMTAACLFASIAHEMGHFVAMLLLRDVPACITLDFFGMRVERRPTQRLGYAELSVVSLSGPLVNVLGSILLWHTAPSAALIHGVLAVFHLLPITSLDGGEALYAVLCRRLSEERAERMLRICSVMVLCPLTVLSVYMFFESGYNFTLLAVSGYLILRMFLREGH